MRRLISLAVLLCLLPLSAQAWWNGDWKFRRKITVNTSPVGADVKENVAPAVVAVRLHSGNFLFSDARADGSDIRFVAADDKTPLKQFVEVYDAINQLAIVWVQLPSVAAASSAEFLYLYSGNEKIDASGDAKSVYDPQQLLGLEFAETQGPFKDGSAYASPIGGEGVKPDPSGLFGNAAAFDGAPLKVAPAPAVHVAANGTLTFSVWLKPAVAQKSQLFAWGSFVVLQDGERLSAQVDQLAAHGGTLKPGEWAHVAVIVSDHMTLYVNGSEAATLPVKLPDLSGEMVIGQNYRGAIDSLWLIGSARSAAWAKLVASQGLDGKLLGFGEAEASEEAGGTSYIKILFSSLTVDAKFVIAILAMMFLIAVLVMVSKAVVVSRTEANNARFLDAFGQKPQDYLNPASELSRAAVKTQIPHSSLLRLYQTGIRELQLRLGSRPQRNLSAESVAAIKASIDSTLIRENQRLNQRMVLLTIAISGGPFLGLLGTVVGVMITFASIAAQGDVNVNAIAPGIAAALLATVAGLAVAIPSLFGYNYLITRIKGISADMQAFSDEFICKMAEFYKE